MSAIANTQHTEMSWGTGVLAKNHNKRWHCKHCNIISQNFDGGYFYGAAMVVLLLCTAMYATAGVEETLHNWGHNKLSRQICMEKNYISIK